jgi:hypothetical protein
MIALHELTKDGFNPMANVRQAPLREIVGDSPVVIEGAPPKWKIYKYIGMVGRESVFEFIGFQRDLCEYAYRGRAVLNAA